MKKISTSSIFFYALLFLIFNAQNTQAQFASQNVSLLSTWDNPAIPPEPSYGIRYSGMWGWSDGAGKEYAIMGGGDGTYFVDVTNPSIPVPRDFVAGRRDSCIWREIKTYGHYCYMVSDDAPPNSFQIADLSYLPDSVHVVYDSNTLFERSHTIFISDDNLYCASVKGGIFGFNSSPLAVFSLANPEQPVLLRDLFTDYPSLISYAHDMTVKNDTVYVSAGYNGLFIFRFNANNTFTHLGSMTSYPNQGYNHSTALSDDGKYLVLCEEVPENLLVKIVDLTDFANLHVVEKFQSNAGATPHNPFMVPGNKVLISYYEDGLQIFDVSDTSNIVRTGFFDTYYQNGSVYSIPPYAGCWGAYPYLPSGIVLATDMQSGLFVLNADGALGIHQHPVPVQSSANAYYNNSENSFEIIINSSENQKINYQLFNPLGQTLFSSDKTVNPGLSSPIKINGKNLSQGIYILALNGENFNYTKKIFKGEH